jgi:tetratricopeptide (TPR) repeat protein
MLEFLDALLRGGQGRMAHVTDKLQRLLAEQGLPPQASMRDLDEALQAAVLLGARDVFLQELLDLARREGSDEVLLQAAASNLPITPAGLARALGGADGDATPLTQALARLEHLSLLHRFADGCVWVHHWTAQGLARLVDAHAQGARHIRAGRYRLWRVEHESHSLDDAVEAVRNFAAGQDFDAAVASAQSCFAALTRFGQTVGIAGLASELLETLSPEHPGFAAVADQEAQAHLALGFMDRAVARYTQLQTLRERLAAAEPQRADYQRDLSVSYIKVGDLYRALGQGEQAREAYLQALAIHERLAAAEPQRADYQRDLSVSYERMGDLYRALGQGEQAREAYLKDLAIAERLAAAEPERADYQRDLVASLHRVGAAEDPPATEHLQRALSILEALQHSGRLAPVDEPMVAALRQLLRDLGPSDQSTP